MHDATAVLDDSESFLRLRNLFLSLDQPCGLDDIVRFNLLYSHLYPHLSPSEKRRAEDFADALMAYVEDPALADKIHGVA